MLVKKHVMIMDKKYESNRIEDLISKNETMSMNAGLMYFG